MSLLSKWCFEQLGPICSWKYRILCGCPLEALGQGTSYEYTQHTFSGRIDATIFIEKKKWYLEGVMFLLEYTLKIMNYSIVLLAEAIIRLPTVRAGWTGPISKGLHFSWMLLLIWSGISSSTHLHQVDSSTTTCNQHSGSVVERSGCGFDPQLGHTKDFKNGTSCSFAWRSALRK